MSETNTSLDIYSFIITKPEIIWMLSLMGAVCVIGVVEYLKTTFFEKKKMITRYLVLILSVIIAITLSPLTPPYITVIIILTMLIISLSTIGKKHIVDGIGKLIDGIILKSVSKNDINNLGEK